MPHVESNLDDSCRPRLRGHLAVSPDPDGTGLVVVWDKLRLSRTLLRVTSIELDWMDLFDGQSSLAELHGRLHDAQRHPPRSLDDLAAFVRRRDAYDQCVDALRTKGVSYASMIFED
jgi:hypothetical protein